MEYSFREVEAKWKNIWQESGLYKVENHFNKEKYYVLDMFPYPSGSGLHVGHPLGYIASDIVSRKKRMEGYQVLHPMGFDAFGLPAEQYAIQTGIHPAQSTLQNIKRYRDQLLNIGLSYDWSREVITCEPAYYKWTQWIFLKLFSHYYNTEQSKARPIEELIQEFERTGNLQTRAAHSEERLISADAWKNMAPKEKDDVLMNYRLAYRKTSSVNWCEALGTVLANDEVKDGVSERGGHPVEKRPMLQWALRISAYTERLLHDLDLLEWPESLKSMQRNWIGKSKGALIRFQLQGDSKEIEVYTTRPDTLFGCSFLVLAPEHHMVPLITLAEYKDAVESYRFQSSKKSERDRLAETKTASGVFTGSYVLHPFTREPLQVWIADYVLIEYGTGAIMAVPGHDTRDAHFAKTFQLPILKVVDFANHPNADIEDKNGILIHSSFLNGLKVEDAIDRMLQELQVNGIGRTQVQYRMRDANFSRQRYWGEPIPIVYSSDGCAIPLSENELPLKLPHLDHIQPGEGGKSPLSAAKKWLETENGLRETDTMPGYAGSSWYFLRYMDADNSNQFASKEALSYWKDVDLYIGGTEHAVGHLMYARFWHKFLYDLGYVPTLEPFKKLVNQGMIQGVIESIFLLKNEEEKKFVSATISSEFDSDELAKIPVHIEFVKDYNTPHTTLDKEGIRKFMEWRPEFKHAIFSNESESGQWHQLSDQFRLKTISEVGKMSKRYHNVVNPDDVIATYGADCFRMYEMFLGPIEQSKPWDTKGIDGVSKFLKKFFGLFLDEQGSWSLTDLQPTAEELKVLHQCIKKVNADIDLLNLNTSISAFMICTNELKRMNCNKREILIPLTRLMAPFAPFITEEIWNLAGMPGSIHLSDYPTHSEQYLVSDQINYPVSVNGKKRLEWKVNSDLSPEELKSQVLQLEEIRKWLEGKPVKNIIHVPGRMINIVI